jgi:FkbM family methyltransferase
MANHEYHDEWQSRYIDGIKSISTETWYCYCDFITDIVMAVACDPGKTSLDVGCSKGRFTGWMARLSNRVIAFDPDHSLLDFKNIWDCWWCEPQRQNTIYISTAVGDRRSVGTYHQYKDAETGVDRPGWASMSSNPYKNPMLVETNKTAMPIEMIDNLVSGPVGFMKIDVEGYDIESIRGAARVIRENRPIMVIESDKTTQVIRELNAIGYAAWPLGWPLEGPITDQGLCLLNILAVPAERSLGMMRLIKEAVNPYVRFTAQQLDTGFDYPRHVRWVSSHLRGLFNRRAA